MSTQNDCSNIPDQALWAFGALIGKLRRKRRIDAFREEWERAHSEPDAGEVTLFDEADVVKPTVVKFRLATFGVDDGDGDVFTKEGAIDAADSAMRRGVIDSYVVVGDGPVGWIEATVTEKLEISDVTSSLRASLLAR